ncbi:MAG: DUF4434 domain-containing protein [Clostridium sp.]|uniref:DUF4434 domain-containing protein n=1 Tax=Clostridium sp. TaxID=1506 RepID=UPI0025C2D326|nr:DUF4434 domain-containing protein [Clostridium sp.]MCH3965586.1 DUF4434 domain-containing protein [Clostridium sp.]MCI1716914.1 DUF4434 domain-containing protein [Clostridium sp.]MCI1801156.1 DUF4434 domain-containing protein [Clostridium sp.]MCI1815100.1 DUF4434 domain-containing protein [Clostridium sp.]MCI1872003.1 DUF4434 domain-containing protein [Clostridium sp.]
MKNRKIIIMLFVSVILFTCVIIYFRSPLRANKNYPILAGSFIQIDLTQNWDEDKWMSELKCLKENKMEYVILSGITFTANNVTKTAYSSNIQGTEKVYGSRDEVELCLKSAEKLGMKVFLSTDFNSEWWNKSANDTNWLDNQMNRTNLICDEVYRKYHSKYKNSFYGWYFPYEIDNVKFDTDEKFAILANAMNITLNYLEAKKERLPFLLSPFMNSAFGTPDKYADNWKYFFSITNLKEGDILCPQDSVGAGGLDISEVNQWFTSLRKAVDSKSGLKLWANVETFDYVNNSTVTLDRLLQQMEMEQPCVDKIVSFSYSHYYSPNNIDPGFNQAYSEYVRKGKLPHNKINTPKNLRVQTINKDEFKLIWDKPKNDKNICGYKVYRDGILIYNPMVQRKYGGKKKEFYLSVIDRPILKTNTKSYTYEVKAVDFSGNMSEASEAVTVNVDEIKTLPEVLSVGCKYNLSPRPDFNYDDNGVKLTDGRYALHNVIKDKSFSAWYNDPFNVEIDLKNVKKTRQFMIDCYRNPRAWAMLPKAVSVAVSQNGIDFTPAGLFRIPSVPFSDRKGSKYPLYIILDKSVDARYVRFTVIPEPNYYTFIDEVQVRN